MPAMDKFVAGNLFLVGLMGAGKTTLGKQFASLHGSRFYDSDQFLCEKTGVSIPTIFELEGEVGFRERESAVIDELTRLDNIVLATGGGAVLRADNRAMLRERGTVVYLHVLPETLIARTGNDRNRPLLQVADPLQKMRDLYALRDPIYREVAHVLVDVGNESLHETFAKLQSEWVKLNMN